MKQGWEYTKLSDVCHITSGYTPKSNELLTNGDIPYYKVADMNTIGNEVYLDYTQLYKNTPCKTFAKGSVVFPKNGAAIATNKKRVLKHESIVDLNTAAATFTNEVNNIFGYYWFKNIDFKNFTRGGALPTLDIKTLKDSTFPLPSLEEQTYIVSELNRINRLIEIKKSQLNDFEILSQSLFSEMFGDPHYNEKGWNVKKLGDVCSEIKYGTSKPACDNGKYKYLRMCNLSYDGYLDLTDVKRIDVSDEEIEKCIVRYGDILFNRTNSVELIGKTCMFDQQEPMVIAGYIIRVRLTNELMPQVLARMFNLASIKKLLRSMAKGAVNQANINSKELASIQIPIPPLALQQHFVKRIELIEQQKSEINSTIAELETLLASRMQYWFD